jgi:hypothetical protein
VSADLQKRVRHARQIMHGMLLRKGAIVSMGPPDPSSFPANEHTREQSASGKADMSEQNREEVDAKIAASEARGETKIARLEGKLDLVLARVEASTAAAERAADEVHRNSNTAWQAAGVVIAALALLFTLGQWMYGSGAQLRDAVRAEVELQQAQTPSPPSDEAKE